MSQSEIVRFPSSPAPAGDNNPSSADEARERIAGLPNPYLKHAAIPKEHWAGAVKPVSPADEVGYQQHPIASPYQVDRSNKQDEPEPRGMLRIRKPKAAGDLPPKVVHAHDPAPATRFEPESPRKPEPVVEAAPVAMQSTLPPPVPLATPLPKPTGPVIKASPLTNAPDDPAAANSTPSSGGGAAAAVAEPRSLPHKLQPLLVGVVTFILLFLVFRSPIFISQLQYLIGAKDKPSTTVTTPKPSAISPNPVVSIPKINVNAPVVFASDNNEAAIQKDLESGIVHYAGTALPGTNGNAVIFGHSSNDWWEPGNYKFVFVLLDKLVVGDTFTANYNSHQYVYQVVETKVVEPTDVSVLNQTTDPQMTLITCSPPGTSWKRLIVRAKQISPAPEAASPAATKSPDVDGTIPGSAPGIADKIADFWHKITSLFGGGDSSKSSGQTSPSTLPSAQ